jgi:hypothetical protein
VVVEDLEQAALLRPVGLGSDADAPEATGPARVGERVDDVVVRVAGDPGDRVGEFVQEVHCVGLEVDRLRVARVEVAARVEVVPVRIGEQAEWSQLVGGVGDEALGCVVAEEHHQLVGGGGSLQLPAQPFELRVVDVPVRGRFAGRGEDRARLRDRVDGDEAHPRGGAPGVVAGGAFGGRLLSGVDKVEAMAVGLRAGAEDVLVLLLGDELAFRIAGDDDRVLRARQQRSEQVRGVEQRGEQAGGVFGIRDRTDRLEAAGRDQLEGGVGGRVPLHERVVVAEGDIGRHGEAGRRERVLSPVL